MKTAILLTLCLSMPSAFAFIGITVGNGGHVVACHDSDGNVVVPQALDLYEGQLEHGYAYPPETQFTDPVKIAITMAARIDAVQDDITPQTIASPQSLVERVNYVVTHMHRVRPGTDLGTTPDSKEKLRFPEGCGLYQAVNFHDSGDIQVDPDLWDTLSPINKAALYLHEAVYWYLRENGIERDSRRTRHIVAYMMSGKRLLPRAALPNGVRQLQYCRAVDNTSKFLAYRDLNGQLTLQFLKVDGHQILTRTLLTGGVNGALEDLPLQPNEPDVRHLVGPLSSPMDGQGVLEILWGGRRLQLSGTLLPETNFRSQVQCSPL